MVIYLTTNNRIFIYNYFFNFLNFFNFIIALLILLLRSYSYIISGAGVVSRTLHPAV